MAEFLPCLSISMEATTAAASPIGLSSSSRIFFLHLPRQSVRVSNLRRGKQPRNLLLSKPNSDLDIVSINEWPDGSIIFHFGHRRELVREGVETEKSKVSTSASDEVVYTEATISTEEVLGKDHLDKILVEEAQNIRTEKVETNEVVDGVHDYGTTKSVHGNYDKSKELTPDKHLDVKSHPIGCSAAVVTSADSKVAVGPDLGSRLLDEKVNEGKDIINKVQFDASTFVSSSNGAQLDHTTSEVDNILDQSQVDTKKEEDNAISEAEFDAATMVSNSEGSQRDDTSNEQTSVIDEAQIDTSITVSNLNDLQLDESIKKVSNAISGVQFNASNVVSSSDGSQLDGNVTDESSIIAIKKVAFGKAHFYTSTNEASSNGSQLNDTTNKENNIIGEAQLGNSTGAPKVDGSQHGHTTNENVSIMETEVVTTDPASNTDGSQLDDKANQESTVFSRANQSHSSPFLSKPDVTLDSFIEKKSEIKTLVEDISSVSLNPAISSHPIDKSKEENVQTDHTDRPTGATDSKHNPENLTGDDSKVMLASTSSEASPSLMESASHETTSTAAEEGLAERSLEEARVRDEVHSGDSAKTSQASMGESGYSETDSNREEVLTTEFCLSSGVASLPHPSKALTGGEDAYFISQWWLGIADGACQWSMEGVHMGLYAQELMENSKEIMSTRETINDPTDLIVRSTARTVTPGLSTALVAHFNGQALHVANIGDTGFMVIRNGIILKRSAPMVHEFNFPVQMETGDDPWEIVECYKTKLEEGDIIVFATDGMFDNLYEEEILSIIQKSLREGLKPQDIANILATRAHEVGSSTSARSPFADEAHAAGYVGYAGGKLDDVTVIVSLLERNSNSHLGV